MGEKTSTLAGWVDIVLQRSGQAASSLQITQLLEYFHLLKEHSARYNLTAITDDAGIAIKHLLDCLAILPLLDQEAVGKEEPLLVDVGSGAGFPGLIIKIMRPGWNCLLLDSLAKRTGFLTTVIEQLKLAGIRAEHGRAEDAGRKSSLRDKHDVAVARAVAPLNILAEYCLPLVAPGACFIAMKGTASLDWPAAEPAVSQLGARLEKIDEFLLAGTDMQRSLFVIRKTGATPDRYPRRAGKIAKNPL